MSSNSSAYPYTLQPLPYSLSVEEQQDAQFLLWQAGNVISRKTWLILAAICAAAIVGIVLVNGYSTVIFWLMLVGVALFLAVRFYGLAWYVRREMGKQKIEAIQGFKMGVQPHGLIMVQRVNGREGSGLIEWKNFSEWRENDKYLYLTFNMKGQTGTQIIPKRMSGQKFPIDTVRKHLTETVGAALK